MGGHIKSIKPATEIVCALIPTKGNMRPIYSHSVTIGLRVILFCSCQQGALFF